MILTRARETLFVECLRILEADIYIIVDGDDTYEASKCVEMVNSLISDNLDMIVATRKTENSESEYRRGHIFGNWILTRSVSLIFRSADLLICFQGIELCHVVSLSRFL